MAQRWDFIKKFPHNSITEFTEACPTAPRSFSFTFGPDYNTTLEMVSIGSGDPWYRGRSENAVYSEILGYGPQSVHRGYVLPNIHSTSGGICSLYPKRAKQFRGIFDSYTHCPFTVSGQWFSLVTLSPDSESQFLNVITVNFDANGLLNINTNNGSNTNAPSQVIIEAHADAPRYTQDAWHTLETMVDYGISVPGFVTVSLKLDRKSVKLSNSQRYISNFGTEYRTIPEAYACYFPIESSYDGSNWNGIAKTHFGLYCRGDFAEGYQLNNNLVMSGNFVP